MEGRTRTVFGSGMQAQQSEAKAGLSELVMAWARDIETGQARYILELDAEHRGKKCGCECVSCGEPLTAVNAGKEEQRYKRRPHFRHPSGVSKDSCAVLAARAAALRLLVEDGVLDLPSRSVPASWTGLSGKAYEGTASSPPERTAIAFVQYRDRASAVLELADGRQVLVSLTGTNIEQEVGLGADGKAMSTIFIDINDPTLASLDKEELRSRLKLLPGSVCWRNHWNDEELKRQAELEAMEKPQALLDWPSGEGFDLDTLPSELRHETLLHLTVKDILAQAGQLRVPELAIEAVAGTGAEVGTSLREVMVKAQTITLRDVRLENRFGNVIPDVCGDGSDADGLEMGVVFVEVTVTHGFDDERIRRIEQAGRPALEIDLREAFGRVSRSQLAKLVIDGMAGKRWLHYPGVEERRRALRTAAEAAAAAKSEELQRRRERPQDFNYLGRPRQADPNRAAGEIREVDVAAANGDLARCRILVSKRISKGWAADENLLDGLVSLRHGIGVGCQKGLTPAQIAHKLRCTVDTRLHSLVLMVLRAFEPLIQEVDNAVLTDWAGTVRVGLKQHEAIWMPKQGDLILLRDLFPELEAASEKLLAMLQRPADSASTWSTGTLPTDRAHRVDAARKFYRDGAYRLYAPAIDYDKVLAEARQARARQVSLGKMLAQWAAEFKLGDDHKPILAVLREAGLIT